MYIRQTPTNNKATGEAYYTFRLVRGQRIGGRVQQITILNLGRHFSIKRDDWPLLCSRLEQLLQPQANLLDIACSDHIERIAQQYYLKLIAQTPTPASAAHTANAATAATAATSISYTSTPHAVAAAATTAANISTSHATPTTAAPAPISDFHEVDINTLKSAQPRSVGVEHVALHAIQQLGLLDKLTALGVNAVMRAAILGNLIARMAHPASESASWNWLKTHSALGELLDVDFVGMSHMRLYRASDLLMRHRSALEDHVFNTASNLFTLDETVTLYDLTNTYFEGEAADNPKAKRGRSKEKRSDCPLVTMGLVLDGSGFVRRSKVFEGNVVEGTTLAEMLKGLAASKGALVIMDAGIATEANLQWLATQGYRYLVVRRGGSRQFDPTDVVAIETAGGETVRLQKELSPDSREVLLYCHSAGREAKETAMVALFGKRFEAALTKIADGLTKPRTEKRHDKLLERIGKLKQRSRGASQHYTVTLTADESGKQAVALNWEKSLVAGTMATHPGVYCLRSNELTWDEEKLWRTYSMLTDLESVFRSLKSELGLRPVFHSTENRVDGHLFLTVLAYQCVQVLRMKLRAAGIADSWAVLRETLSVQRRTTMSVNRRDGRTIHVRRSSDAEPALLKIYNALGLNAAPGGTRKVIA